MDIVRLEYWNEWNSQDNSRKPNFGFSGYCPGYQLTMSTLSTESMDKVQGVHGHCPGSPWTLSRETVDVHRVHGHCPVWVGSLDFVHSINGHCPDYPLIPWTMSRESMDSLYILPMGYFTEISMNFSEISRL